MCCRQGLPSFYKVMKGIELLKKHGVEYNAMAVVNDYNVDYPLEFYNFFKELDCRFIQFAPIVERIGRYNREGGHRRGRYADQGRRKGQGRRRHFDFGGARRSG